MLAALCGAAWAQPLLSPGLQAGVQNPSGSVRLQTRAGQLQALDAQGQVLRQWPVPEGVLPVLVLAARQSFVVAPRGARELWEVSWAEDAPPIYDGLVHDYRMGEALARPGYLGLRRTPLQRPLAALCTCGAKPYVRVWEEGRPGSAVLHLDVRRVIARCTGPEAAAAAAAAATGSGSAPGASHPGCGCPACPPQ
jgi:hypothetical protein